MVELRDRLRLALEADPELRVLCEFGRKDLDGHAAVETRVGGLPHLSHAARADTGDDLVRAKPRAGCDLHEGCCRIIACPARGAGRPGKAFGRSAWRADIPVRCGRTFLSGRSTPVVPTRRRSRGDVCDEPAAAIRNFPIVNRAVFQSLGDYDFRPLLAKLRVPALVVEGARTNVPLDATREMGESRI